MGEMSESRSVLESEEKIAKMSFEEAMKRLEDVLTQLESGQAPLDEAVSLYEYGDKLRRHCARRLENAQLRLKKITSEDEAAL